MLTPNIDLQHKSILITGAAGFIGANLVMELLRSTDSSQLPQEAKKRMEMFKALDMLP